MTGRESKPKLAAKREAVGRPWHYLLGVQNQLFALLDGLWRCVILCYDLRLLVSSTPELELVTRRTGSLLFRLSGLVKKER